MNKNSHNQRLMSEAKEVREYTDKQENRCKSLLNRLSKIQIDLLHAHTQEQLKSLLKQPAKKFGLRQTGKKLSSSGSANTPKDVDIKPDPLPTSISGISSEASNGDAVPNVPVKPKKKRNPLYDTPLWKMSDIAEIDHVNSSFESVLHQTTIGNQDLEETESSSGDSSCDETMFIQEEADGTPKRVTHYLPVDENPAYKFAQDRARIIAVWTWLQDAISNLSYKIKQQEEFLKHLMIAKPPFQFDDHPLNRQPIDRQSSRSPSNAALKDACIQIFTAHINSQVPPTSTQVFYAGERESPYITDAAGKVIQLITHPTPASTSSSSSAPAQKQPNSDTKSANMSPQEIQASNSIVGGGLELLGLTIQTNHDPSCTARRCMPLKPFKQRKIYQLGGIHNMSSFSGRAPTLLCTCFGRTELCAVCSGRARKTKAIDVEVMDQKEVHELLDHNYHRTLSLPDEIPIANLIESALKREGWTGQIQRPKSKFKRLIIGWERPRSQLYRGSQFDEFGSKKRPRGRPRLPKGLDQFGQMIIKQPKTVPTLTTPVDTVNKRANWRTKDRRNPINRRASYGDMGGIRRAMKIRRKKYNSISCGKGLTTSRRRERDSGLSDEDGFYDGEYQNFEDFDGLSNKSDKRLSQSGRKLNQDYDIDNIVIPYSIASSTRVEKIEYKEILTPSWRVVSQFNPEGIAGGDEHLSSDGEMESQTDLSEEAIKVRHDRCEVDEHKRFHSVPDKSSRRTRRFDSRSETLETFASKTDAEEFLSQTDSQDGGSVDPTSPNLPLPPSESEETIVTDLQTSSGGGAQVSRRRTISSASTELEESKIEIDTSPRTTPFEPRHFPLTDDEYEAMNKEMPPMEDEIKDERRRYSPNTVQISSDPDMRRIGKFTSSRISSSFDPKNVDTEEDGKDEGELELMDLGEESEGDEDDPDWQRPPGERAV